MSEPLTAEEEAELRRDYGPIVDERAAANGNPVHETVFDVRRLLATLDAARSATPSSEAVPAADGLRELRALSEAATPGPWGAYISYSGESGTPDEAGLFVNDKAHDVDGEKQTIISDFSLYASEHLPDLEFIVAAVNYVRAALASTERAATPDGAGEDGLRGALERIVRINDRDFDAARDIARMAIEAADRATPARSDAGDGLDLERLAATEPWLADIVRCAEAAFAKWEAAHRNEANDSTTFIGADGPFYEAIRSVVSRLRDFHFEVTRAARLSESTGSEEGR
jgi:hypothetical protein